MQESLLFVRSACKPALMVGQREGRFFHGRLLPKDSDSYCYLPLYVFCGQQLLCAYLQPSCIDGARHAAAILKLLVRRLRQEWPDVRIIFRGDSGFCRARIINWCERADVRTCTTSSAWHATHAWRRGSSTRNWRCRSSTR